MIEGLKPGKKWLTPPTKCPISDLIGAASQRRGTNHMLPPQGQRKERDMALNPALTVRVERKPGAFGDTMNEIRTWLDHTKIQPVSFKPVAQARQRRWV